MSAQTATSTRGGSLESAYHSIGSTRQIRTRAPTQLPPPPKLPSKPRSALRDHKRARLQKFWEEAQRDKVAGEKRAKEKREKQIAAKDEKFRTMIVKLEDEKALVDQVADYLLLKDATDQRKKVQLFEQWNEHVFDPIQDSVKADMHKRDILQIEERKRANFEEFLQTVGRKKGGVFRDIVIEEDYDPFKDHAHTIKYNSRKINQNDPLRREKNKVFSEQKITKELNPDKKYIESRSRKGLSCLMWDKLDATPYARYEDPPKPSKNNIRKTTFVLDHYNVNVSQAQVRDEYFQRGKKVYEVKGAFKFAHQP